MAAGATPVAYHEIGATAAGRFHQAIAAAKTGQFAAAVTVKSANEYKSMRTFLTPDGKAGFALDSNDLVSAFKHPDSNIKQFATSALGLGVQLGAKRLDCFDTVLPRLYSKSGFRAVARLPWDDKYAPPDWNKSTFKEFNGGRPDVVFMVHSPKAAVYRVGDGNRVKDYDAGVAAQHAALGRVKKYNPDQPRVPAGSPEGGQFGAGGGATTSKPATALLKQPTETADQIVARVPGAAERVAKVRSDLAKSVPTDAPVDKGGHKLPDGGWTPERKAAHNKILAETFSPEQIAAATPGPGEKPTLHILGGRGGAGKSWFTDPKRGGTVDASKALMLNNDDIKAKLPGFSPWKAALFHEESSHVGDRAEKFALENKLNVIIDGTMRSPQSAVARIDAFKRAGYEVHGHYMYLSPQTSAERALGRFMRGGRYVPVEYSLGSTTNEKSFDAVKSKLDKWEIYDNSGKEPKLYAKSK